MRARGKRVHLRLGYALFAAAQPRRRRGLVVLHGPDEAAAGLEEGGDVSPHARELGDRGRVVEQPHAQHDVEAAQVPRQARYRLGQRVCAVGYVELGSVGCGRFGHLEHLCRDVDADKAAGAQGVHNAQPDACTTGKVQDRDILVRSYGLKSRGQKGQKGRIPGTRQISSYDVAKLS
ncbi:hypothetical protein PG987_003348 [Apiospora arundinis]